MTIIDILSEKLVNKIVTIYKWQLLNVRPGKSTKKRKIVTGKVNSISAGYNQYHQDNIYLSINGNLYNVDSEDLIEIK